MGSVPENDGSVAAHEDAAGDVVADAAGERETFAIAAESEKILGGVEVFYTNDFLFDDGTFIEFWGCVMACCPDQFDSAFVRTLVGVCADERGEKTVMDVHDPAGPAEADIGRDNLHVAGEDDEVCIMFGPEGFHLLECVAFGIR